MVGHVKVLLHATFREIAGQREIVEEVNSSSTLGDVLEKLAKKYGRDFHEIVDSKTDQISSEVLVTVNGKSVRKTDVKLEDKDVVIITVPVGGG